MTDDVASYLDHLERIVTGREVATAFAEATVRHQRMELDFNRRLLASCPAPDALAFPHLALAPAQYWQRNFFSILFLSIFEALGIPRERQHLHGMLLHAVRGIVTATDNILDDEAKGSVRLKLGGAKVLPNILVTLLETGVFHQVLRELCADERRVGDTWRGVMRALFSLGAEESEEEELAIEDVLEPKALLDQVHRVRGGGLLLLAFIAPEINEPQLTEAIQQAKSGVNLIGLALQILDDLTDFQEDLRQRNHNMLRSWIVWHQPDGPCSDAELSRLPDAVLETPETHFRIATSQVMQIAIEMALAGFERLQGIGHPADRRTAQELIGAMFTLRGLARLWNVYAAEPAPGLDYARYFPS